MGKHVYRPGKNPIRHPKSSNPKGKGWKFNETVKHKQQTGGFHRPKK